MVHGERQRTGAELAAGVAAIAAMLLLCLWGGQNLVLTILLFLVVAAAAFTMLIRSRNLYAQAHRNSTRAQIAAWLIAVTAGVPSLFALATEAGDITSLDELLTVGGLVFVVPVAVAWLVVEWVLISLAEHSHDYRVTG